MKDQKKNYIEPREFFDETIKCLQKDQMSNTLGDMFGMLAQKYCNHPLFVRYAHIRDDLISVGILACCNAFPKFKPYRKLGILIKNSLVKKIDAPLDENGNQVAGSWYSYKFSGDTIKFSYDEISKHYENFQVLIEDFEEENGPMIDWENENLEYDYKYHNNPFAFFTTCIRNSLIQFLKNEYNEKNIFNKLKLQSGLDADYGYTEMVKDQEAEEAAKEALEFEDDIIEDDLSEDQINEPNELIKW